MGLRPVLVWRDCKAGATPAPLIFTPGTVCSPPHRLDCGLCPGHSPLEGESQKPSRQAKADAVGGVNSPPPGSRPRQPIAHDRRLRGRIAKIQGNRKKSPRFRRVANRTHSNPPPRTGSRQPRSLATPPPCRADHSRKNSRSLMKTNHQWTRINTNRPEDRWTCFNHKRHHNASAILCPWCDDVMG